jgi:UDP-N-acetylglucosamine--N-acetylmuramyl-(pentapeptide) pyrophosphoryl-undecaprenol N-acetylglucosamine transferase
MNGVVIAGGGTGGHIFPAVAIAQALKKENPNLAIDFVGSTKGLEKKIIPRENFPLHLLNVGAINQVGGWTKISTLMTLPLAIIQAGLLLIKLKPKAVLGVGGYASGPVMIAALFLKPFLKYKLTLFEANAMPGLTNRWLASFADVAFTNFEASNRFFKRTKTVGIPIRTGLRPAAPPRPPPFRILIFGGSQGARGINITVSDAIRMGGSWLEGVEIVHQIGSTDFAKFDALYKKMAPPNVKWFEFLYDMPERYQSAHLVFCRAGASTLAELAACHKAAILIPFPFASDNHQQENAQAIASHNGAVLILQKDFTPERFIEFVQKFKSDPALLNNYEKEVARFFKGESAETVAHALLEGNP